MAEARDAIASKKKYSFSFLFPPLTNTVPAKELYARKRFIWQKLELDNLQYRRNWAEQLHSNEFLFIFASKTNKTAELSYTRLRYEDFKNIIKTEPNGRLDVKKCFFCFTVGCF